MICRALPTTHCIPQCCIALHLTDSGPTQTTAIWSHCLCRHRAHDPGLYAALPPSATINGGNSSFRSVPVAGPMSKSGLRGESASTYPWNTRRGRDVKTLFGACTHMMQKWNSDICFIGSCVCVFRVLPHTFRQAWWTSKDRTQFCSKILYIWVKRPHWDHPRNGHGVVEPCCFVLGEPRARWVEGFFFAVPLAAPHSQAQNAWKCLES